IEQDNLFRQFKMDEPWDGPNNIRLLGMMPKVYSVTREAGGVSTHYQGFAGKDAAFEPGRKLRLVQDFPDGTSNTVLVVEARDAGAWTKPADLPFDAKKPLPKFGVFPEGFHGLMADGSVHTFGPKPDEAMMRLVINRQDGMPIDFDKLHAD